MTQQLEWITNMDLENFSPLNYPNFQVVTGRPVATSVRESGQKVSSPLCSVEELESMGVIGVYRVVVEDAEEDPTLRAFARFFVGVLNAVTKKPVETSEVNE